MRVTFIQPRVGGRPGPQYPRTWQMEPLWAAALAAVTPPEVERDFFDDRQETIPSNHPTDLVGLSVETYTARRAYQLAASFRARGVRVVMGGMHVTLQPEESAQHADAIVLGEAEGVWPQLLKDAARGELRPRYAAPASAAWIAPQPDRSVYAHRDYGRLRLVETSRGCRHNCEFCSITAFYRQRVVFRPVAEVVADIQRSKARLVFFVDDNLLAAPERLHALCEALTPLRIHWLAQIGIRVTEDEGLLRAMRRSGCAGVLIGFESLRSGNLAAMRKPVSGGAAGYSEALARLRRHRLSVYGTFMFGYDGDTADSFEDTLAFAIRHRFFFAAFNHLVPFPGTPLYARLRSEGRLVQERWWLDGDYHFGDVAFRPRPFAPEELSALCTSYRRRFYGWPSLVRRFDFQVNSNHPFKALAYLWQNLLAGREVERRSQLALGS